MKQTLIDGIQEVSIVSGLIRMDLFSYTAGARDEQNKPPREVVERLVVSPEGFLQMYNTLDKLVRQMEGKGLLQRRQPADETLLQIGAEQDSPPPVQRAQGSANFA
ncbi:hypothetical protein QCD60_08635 [Pokkaliibacter sp. MBI-7]|uniref:hypothetical protein n=1 Tax=Pokkaliibacter sp. MBI-7 TaxID=3040600 RepID=UPI002447AEAB|nr:hypothetical protein [Pokkaliibacter sp. MBI-7]MDH2432632.1 hypothetical protein [Pokkaliibacter sp. MBI-7]